MGLGTNLVMGLSLTKPIAACHPFGADFTEAFYFEGISWGTLKLG